MEFSHTEKLHAALCRLAPQIRTVLVTNKRAGLRHLEVAHGAHGPWTVDWSGQHYCVTGGPRQGTPLGSDPEDAAACVAELLGVPLPEAPPARRSWPSAPGAGLTI